MEALIQSLKKTGIMFALILMPFHFLAQDFNQVAEAYQQSYTHEMNGDYQKAISILKDVYQEDDYAINLRLGWLSYMNGLFNESVAYYNKAIQLKPYSLQPRFGLAYPASAMGNWNQVKGQYFKILEIDPQNTTANFRLGMIYYGNEDYAAALKYFEKMVNLYPFDYDGLIMYAWTNLKLGKLREAEVLFKQVLLLIPEDKSALEGLGEIQ